MYFIRHSHERIPCADTRTLQTVLSRDYMGASVSIELQRPSGITHSVFVDVTQEGILESYGGKHPIDFEGLAQKAR